MKTTIFRVLFIVLAVVCFTWAVAVIVQPRLADLDCFAGGWTYREPRRMGLASLAFGWVAAVFALLTEREQ